LRRPAALWLAAAGCLSACEASDPTIALPTSAQIEAPPGDFCAPAGRGRFFEGAPATYRALLSKLMPGDTLLLAPGEYRRLRIEDLHGAPGGCITITGPARPERAVIVGETGYKTVEILDSSYVVLKNLVIDSRNIPGADGVKALASGHSAPHHIVLDGNLIIGAGATQQTDGISTKVTTWNWVIRRNAIIGAGTGLYLGDSDGTAPFIAGVVEDNLIVSPIGYGMQIKYQTQRPTLPGIPVGPQTTIIRNNVFKKDDRVSPDGDRPNLLVGGFPDSGPGSFDLYDIYCNLLIENPREALFQGSGRIRFHDNVLIGGGPAAAVFRDHDLPLRLAEVFGNKIYSPHIGIRFDSPARQGHSIFGNLIYAEIPIRDLEAHPAGAAERNPKSECGTRGSGFPEAAQDAIVTRCFRSPFSTFLRSPKAAMPGRRCATPSILRGMSRRSATSASGWPSITTCRELPVRRPL
jgi:hypothetical protein